MHSIDSFQPIQTWLFNYLLNSLWQLPLLFAAAWLTTRSLRRAGPATQHRIWVSALFLQLLLPACTLSPRQLLNALASLIPWHTAHNTTTALITITTGPAQAHNGLQLPALLLTAIVTTYAFTLLYFTARLLYGLRNTAALRRNTHPIALSAETTAIWQRCSHHFNTPNTQLAASTSAPYPLTIGISNPLILLPTGMPTTVSSDDLSAALAHELAHIHRRDFAKNLAYALISIPLAWHPILWLTRKRIEETREMICDALAAEALTGTQPYARSLLRLAELFVHATPHRNLHAIGIFDTTTFERRLMNLTQKPTQLRTLHRIALTAAVLTLGLATCASALALRLNVSASTTAAPAQTPEPGKTLHVQGEVIAGNRIGFAEPVYPTAAKKAKLSGTVILKAVIGKDGKIKSLSVASSTSPMFDEAALKAVRKWTYKPYLLNGDPTEVETNITINFSLDVDPTPTPTPSPNPTAEPTASNARQYTFAINAVDPKMPAEAGKFSGSVEVSMIVGKDGVPADVAIKRGVSADYDQSALEAVKGVRFQPTLRDGVPVDTPMDIYVTMLPHK